MEAMGMGSHWIVLLALAAVLLAACTPPEPTPTTTAIASPILEPTPTATPAPAPTPTPVSSPTAISALSAIPTPIPMTPAQALTPAANITAIGPTETPSVVPALVPTRTPATQPTIVPRSVAPTVKELTCSKGRVTVGYEVACEANITGELDFVDWRIDYGKRWTRWCQIEECGREDALVFTVAYEEIGLHEIRFVGCLAGRCPCNHDD